MYAVVFLFHVLAAIAVGPIFTLPLLTNAPAALHAVLIMLRFCAGFTLLSGIALWVVLRPLEMGWLYVSLALFLLIIATIAVIIEPAAKAVLEKPELRSRIRLGGFAASALTLSIGALMVVRPNL